MNFIVSMSLISIGVLLAAFVIRGIIAAWRNSVRFAAEALVEDVCKVYAQELRRRDSEVEYYKKCCAHPRLNITVFGSEDHYAD